LAKLQQKINRSNSIIDENLNSLQIEGENNFAESQGFLKVNIRIIINFYLANTSRNIRE
jgi:hypothetical protein